MITNTFLFVIKHHKMDFTKYDDGFFCINEVNGFLPKCDPLATLPVQYMELQLLLDDIPQIIQTRIVENLDHRVSTLPNYIEQVKQEDPTNTLLFQALFRSYAMLSSAYLLFPAHVGVVDGIYGKAKNVLPSNIVQPFEYSANVMKVFPFLDYHYAYSSGNYVKRNPSLLRDESYHYSNLKLANSFSGTSDEEGFIMLHVDIVSKTNQLIHGIKMFLEGNKLGGLQQVLEASIKINERRRDMWKASNFKHYNNFRAFIMGIKGNVQIFGEGVVYEGSENTEIRQYRGQTGEQDDTIPTLDIFTGVIKYYPENDLTRYLLDLRQYRPVIFQEFFKDLEKFTIDVRTLNVEEQIVLYGILEQIYLFRNGHWQFVQNYILKNTKYATATGGTPITTWIPNQIGAVLTYMGDVLYLIGLHNRAFYEYNVDLLLHKREILINQQEELSNSDYDVHKVYDMGHKLNESDLSEHK